MDREITVCILSGLSFAGKSRMLKWLLGQPEFTDSPVINMDEVRHRHFGDTRLSRTGHRYKVELTRQAIKTRLVGNAIGLYHDRYIFCELGGMLTRQYHQKPFEEMIGHTQWYLETIASERSELPIIVIPRIVFIFAQLPTVISRVERRNKDAEGQAFTDVLDLSAYHDEAEQWEPPSYNHPFLYVDTTDEDQISDSQQKEMTAKFFSSGVVGLHHGLINLVGESDVRRMKQEAVAYRPPVLA